MEDGQETTAAENKQETGSAGLEDDRSDPSSPRTPRDYGFSRPGSANSITDTIASATPSAQTSFTHITRGQSRQLSRESSRRALFGGRKRPMNLREASERVKQDTIRRFRMKQVDGSNQATHAKPKNLRDATHRLKQAALKRYREKHQSSFEKHEKEIEDEFNKTHGSNESHADPENVDESSYGKIFPHPPSSRPSSGQSSRPNSGQRSRPSSSQRSKPTSRPNSGQSSALQKSSSFNTDSVSIETVETESRIDQNSPPGKEPSTDKEASQNNDENDEHNLEARTSQTTNQAPAQDQLPLPSPRTTNMENEGEQNQGEGQSTEEQQGQELQPEQQNEGHVEDEDLGQGQTEGQGKPGLDPNEGQGQTEDETTEIQSAHDQGEGQTEGQIAEIQNEGQSQGETAEASNDGKGETAEGQDETAGQGEAAEGQGETAGQGEAAEGQGETAEGPNEGQGQSSGQSEEANPEVEKEGKGQSKDETTEGQSGGQVQPQTEGQSQGQTESQGETEDQGQSAEQMADNQEISNDTEVVEQLVKLGYARDDVEADILEEMRDRTESPAPAAEDFGQMVDEEDEGPAIPDDYYYEIEKHISKPISTENSGLPDNLLTLQHSFGYDSNRRCNLHVLDDSMVLFGAGNLVQLVNLQSKEQQYLRSTSGGGIGALAVHPLLKYFAVAEKGDTPNINIYEYPSLKLYRILRGGTERSYAYADFSPDGRLLASVGGSPDFMLTIWDWKREKTVLRSKAFSQDVFRVTFSTELQGQLTSSGTGHIRFWKMAKTFTGLKLQGELGKFGKTEISDIEGFVELPDGKVLSGSEWGNLLLWDGGLIKVEISRRGKKPCHNGAIQQIIMDEGELMTVGEDGYILVWDFETVDTADATDDTAIFEMEPMNELKVGSDVSLKWMVKSVNQDEPTIWYAQDSHGGIWKLDLSFSFTSQAPEKLMSYHSGAITACDTSPVSHLVATTGVDKTVRVYDYMAKSPLCETKFNTDGSSLLWCPQMVDTSGASILVGFKDGVVRALTIQKSDAVDVHGRMVKDQSELVLKQAFKPHNANVTAMAIDCRGEMLATGSEDKTVFFLSINENYKPIGFVQTPSAVTSLDWAPSDFERNTLLVCCLEGQVLEIECPESGNYDTSKTFQLENLPIKTHNFKSIKSRLRHEEELLQRAKEEEERRRKEEEERRIRIERGLEVDKEQEEALAREMLDSDEESHSDSENESIQSKPESRKASAEEEEEEVKDDWAPYIPDKPSPILQGLHAKEPGKFWLSMGEFDAGYLYECAFMTEDEKSKVQYEEDLFEPTNTLSVKDAHDVPITTVKYSKDGGKVFMGMQDGSVRIYPLEDGDLSKMDACWTLNVHDNDYGKVNHMAVSFDDKFLFTVGQDGNFFTFHVMDKEEMEQRVTESKAKVPSAKKDAEEQRGDDIEDTNAYSIEDAKQKSEHDKMVRLAEDKKSTVRRTIEGLRAQFRQLLAQNEQLPAHLRLDRQEFEMAEEIKEELQRQTLEKVAIVKREMSWEEEKHRIALEKLRARFKDVVECERIVVKAFMTSHQVASFRASRLTDGFYQAKAAMERKKTVTVSKEEASRQATLAATGTSKQGPGGPAGGLETKDATETVVMTTLKGSVGNRINKALEKVEEKKKKRAARKAQALMKADAVRAKHLRRENQWLELYSSKPDDNYEDPGDVAAIKEAQDNMGDYKLKSADDYVVPDHLRMNVEKARHRLLLLKDLIHQYKYEFNQRLLSLRDKKLRIIEQVRDLISQLDGVQSKLAEEHQHPLPEIPTMHPDELPEKRLEFTREQLLAWKQQKKAEKNKGEQGSGAFGGFGTGSGANPPPKNTMQNAATPVPGSPLKQDSGLMSDDGMLEEEEVLSDLEIQLLQAQEIRNLYERDRLFKEINGLLKNFDAELRCLRHEKFKLDVVLKNADLRQVTLFEELLLLKDFELREEVLATKVEGKEKERTDMLAKVVEVEQKLDGKRKDLEQLALKERQLTEKFVSSLGENNKFADFLTRVYKKKIKRTKKKATEGEESDESDDSDDDESELSESEEESDSEAGVLDLDTCPPNCDQALYDNTCQLREQRLDLEDTIAEEKKARDTLNKELEANKRKAKASELALKSAQHELEVFQLEKQRKLNELDVVVMLYFHQIQHVVNGILPQDLQQCLVFEAGGIIRLAHRIKELEHEKTLQKKDQKEAKKKHVELIKDRRHFEQRTGEMKDQCDRMMIQKFGCLVDLEKLETVTVNRNIEELKEKLRLNEMQTSVELQAWDEKIREMKDLITQLVRENTDRLDQLNMLSEEKRHFAKALDSRQKNLGSEYSGAREADVHERQRLMQLVHLQAQEIEALKEEMMMLSRKGGHILPPAQPPLPPGSASLNPLPN